jgi:hypothetical protein
MAMGTYLLREKLGNETPETTKGGLSGPPEAGVYESLGGEAIIVSARGMHARYRPFCVMLNLFQHPTCH